MIYRYLTIAGFTTRLCLADHFGHLPIPAAWRPFLADEAPAAPLFTVNVHPGTAPCSAYGLQELTVSFNDLGEARLFTDSRRYVVGLSPVSGHGFDFMLLADDFSSADVWVDPADAYASFTIDSMIRIFFSQAILPHNAFHIHASTVVAGGNAYLFMGRSGTGKSTHSSMWLQAFADTELLNDDNPVVRILPDGSVRVYGSPWSGKTPCYRNVSAPVAGFVRLIQAPTDAYRPLADIDAFIALIPGVSTIHHSRLLSDAATAAVATVAAAVPVGLLECRPHPDAARLCRTSLSTPQG